MISRNYKSTTALARAVGNGGFSTLGHDEGAYVRAFGMLYRVKRENGHGMFSIVHASDTPQARFIKGISPPARAG